MSTTIDNSFIDLWRDEVLHDFQLEGGQLRRFARSIPVVGADTAYFHQLGSGSATQKGRHANIPTMNLAHATDSVSVQDWYAAEYIDDLDMLKTNVDFRKDYNMAIKQALGRAEDDNLLDALAAAVTSTSNTIAAGAAATFDELATAVRHIKRSNARGALCGVISYDFYEDVLLMEGATDTLVYSSKDYGASGSEFKDGFNRIEFDWFGVHWYVYNGLPVSGGAQTNYVYMKDALIHALNKDMTMSIDKVAEKDSWFLSGKISFGSTVVSNREEAVVAITRTYDSDLFA